MVARSYLIQSMKTIEDIRHEWLLELIRQHKTIAELNVALERPRTDGTLSQIKTKQADSKTGKIRIMGSDLARDIENKLGLETGTLDHPLHAVAAATPDEINLLTTFRQLGRDYRARVLAQAYELDELRKAYAMRDRILGKPLAGKGDGDAPTA